MSFIHYVESLLGEAKWNTSEMEASWNCPFCTSRGETEDTKERFRMNRVKLLGVCYNCGWGGNAVSFVRDYQGLTWAESLDVVNFYTDFTPLPQDVFDEVFDRIYLEGKDVGITKKVIPLPSDYKLLAGSTSMMADPFRKYAESRLLTEKQIDLHGIGFCPEGEMKLPNGDTIYLRNRLVTQVFGDNGEPQYWMGRAIRDMKPKTLNPTGGLNTLNKSDVIFNLNNAKKTGVAVLTEGVFDATTIGNSGIALFGKTMSAKQLLLLIKAEFRKIFVMLDGDAIKNAFHICDTLSKHIPEVYFCYTGNADPNELGRKGCLEVLKNAERYNKLTSLKYKLSM